MTETSAGYLVEVPYTPQFHPEHAPLWLDGILTALGRGRPETAEPVWCEVGCGKGIGLVILAATNPAIAFHGIDINPQHIEEAQLLANEAGIINAKFHCADLREVRRLPDFDYIIARGIYSWVSSDVRQAIRRFIGERLSRRGVALLHYLALPGAADFMAVHALFKAIHRQPGLSARQAVTAGQELLADLHMGKAGFFAAHPAADLKAPQIATDDVDYTVHDYLNEHYVPLAAAEVISDMRQQDLHFAGSGSPMDNLDDFSVPGSLRALFARQKSIEMRETIRDLAGNQFSRNDLYLRRADAMGVDEHFAALRRLRFRALPGMPEHGRVTFPSRIGPVEGPAAIFSPILQCFASGEAVAYAEIEALPELAGKPGLVNQALHAMMGAGAIHPVPESEPDTRAAQRLNEVLVERYREGELVPALAAPALGSGLPVQREHLDLLSQGRPLPDDLGSLLP